VFFPALCSNCSISRVNGQLLDPGSGNFPAAQSASRPLSACLRACFHTMSGGFMDSINSRIAEELGVRPQQVEAAVALLDEGSTVPFIARYRKEVTGSLDDTQLRHLEERL